MSESEINGLDRLQKRLRGKYGDNEHEATVGLCRDLGCDDMTVRIVNNLEWAYIPRLFSESETESLLAIYRDMRIGPRSILLLIDRLTDLKNRTNADEFEQNVANGNKLENFIQENVSINLNEISEEKIDSYFETLRNIEI